MCEKYPQIAHNKLTYFLNLFCNLELHRNERFLCDISLEGGTIILAQLISGS